MSDSHTFRSGCLLLALASAATAQRPVIAPRGVVNAASFAPDPERGLAVVRGRLYSIFGENLAPSGQEAARIPLPTTLNGTSVTVNGISTRLLYVSPTQINLQVPFGITATTPTIPVVVTTSAGASDPVNVTLLYAAPGIFTQNGSGCGPGAILNVAADRTVTINSPSQSASPGSYLSVYGTGLGAVSFPPPDGMPAGSDSLSPLQTRGGVRLGVFPFLRETDKPYPLVTAASVQFAAMAPGLVGVDQTNVWLPEDAPEGCAVPLRLSVFTSSQPVTISIRKGGGICEDSPAARTASLRWRKVVTTGPEPVRATNTETFSALFTEGPANLIGIAPSPVRVGWSTAGSLPHPGPKCVAYGTGNIEAGELAIQPFSADRITLPPIKSPAGDFVYEVQLPDGSIQPGALSARSGGSSGIGPFQSTVAVPAPIRITTDLSPGTVVPFNRPFTLTWTGGSPDNLVRVQLLTTIGIDLSAASGTYDTGLDYTAPADTGSVTLGLVEVFEGVFRLPLTTATGRFSVVVRVFPRNAVTFAAQGLTRGEHDWEYEYRFSGLDLRFVAP